MKLSQLLWSFLLIAIGTTNAIAKEPKPLWLVVTTDQFTTVLEPLAERRRADGYQVVVTTEPITKVLQTYSKPNYLLLVGDQQQGHSAEPWHVASQSKPLYKWIASQKPEYATDAVYGDRDADGMPDFAVGRIPARSQEEVKAVVAKILHYESRPWTAKDLEIVIWAGSPMYGPMFDRLATNLALGAIDRYAPRWADSWLQTADDRHALHGWPDHHTDAFHSALSDGACLSVVAAHGWTSGFVSVRTTAGDVSYTASQVAAQTGDVPVAPVLLFTCDSGNFAGSEQCLTEAMLFAPGGPVAAIGATTQSHPLTNYYTQRAVLETLSEVPPTVGDLWCRAQAKTPSMVDLFMEQALKNVEGKLEENINVAKLKRDQLLMYALLGDPATKLRLPKPLEAQVKKEGGVWRWQVEKPDDATELQVSHRPIGTKMPRRPAVVDREQAIRFHQQAVKTLHFAELETFDANTEWAGEVNQSGRLRLVAICNQTIYATTVELESARE